MTGQPQRVDPAELVRQSTEMTGQNWHNPVTEAVTPPDALAATGDAIANLNANASVLLSYQRWAEAENTRIAEMLHIAADAYRAVDETYGTALDAQRTAAVDAITVPAPSTPPPPPPGPLGAFRPLQDGGYRDVHQTQSELVAGDDGASLKAAMLQWGAAATRMRGNAPRPPGGDWEGAAADAAYTRMAELGSWLQQLGDAWHGLAEAAATIVGAHDAAKAEHQGVHGEYIALEAQLQQLAAQLTVGNSLATQAEMDRIGRRMAELQQQSDEVRRDYAGDAAFAPVRPADPVARGADGAVTVGGGAGGGGGPAATAGDMAGRPQTGAGPAPAGSPSGAGSRSGAGSPSGGGTPSGGGAPSGGSGAGAGTPGGLPGPQKSTYTPRLPTDPSLRPAAAAGGGAGAGAGGGGGGSGGGSGGGGGASPMSPAVTAETVAPGPLIPTGAAQGPASSGSTVGAMGGGMAPMGHGAGAQQGREKRRDPQVAPDEDLYTEDRPWTEAVIGRRRRAVQGGREE